MRNISINKGSTLRKLFLSALVFTFLTSLAFCDNPFGEEAQVSASDVTSTEDVSTVITDTSIAKEAGIEEVKDGFPINGKIAANKLRLRSWPWGAVVGKYSKGTSVKVLGESGEFYLVEVDGQQGYMHKSYITTDKQEATLYTPTYPGDTKSGGYMQLKEGIAASNTGAKNLGKKESDSNNNNSNNKDLIDNTENTNYTGVTKVIFDIVKKFCEANEAYVLGAAHSKNSGYVTKSDCSGFTGQFINKLSELAGVNPVIGNSFPTSTNYANSQYTTKVTGAFPPTNPKDLVKPGDIFVMSKGSSGYGHVGVFMGYNSAGQPLIAHSTTRTIDGKSTTTGKLGKTGVRIEVIPSSYNGNRWMGIYRLNNMDQIASKLES